MSGERRCGGDLRGRGSGGHALGCEDEAPHQRHGGGDAGEPRDPLPAAHLRFECDDIGGRRQGHRGRGIERLLRGEARGNAVPHVIARFGARHGVGERGEPVVPPFLAPRESGVGRVFAARGEQLLAFEQAKRPFGGDHRIVARHAAFRHVVFRVAHAASLASRQARRRWRPRRIQLFIVPSGTSEASAS
jgi:hypothetical protein